MARPVNQTAPKRVMEELDFLRNTLLEVDRHYIARLESEIMQVREAVESEAGEGRLPRRKLHDFEEMLALMRGLQIKPGKGRRKDLKKIDQLVGRLLLLKEQW